jgi:hypothetical protein
MGPDGKGNTFILHSLIPPENVNAKNALDKMDGENTNRIRVKYVNKETGQAFLLGIRGLLNLEIAGSTTLADGENGEYDAEADTKKRRVHEYLTTEMEDGKKISLLKEFKVVAAKERTQEGTDAVMYPLYCYQRFNEKVDEINKAWKDAGNTTRADLTEVYRDFTFTQSLYQDGPAEGRENVEPQKSIVIAVS